MSFEHVELAFVGATNVGLGVALLSLDPEHRFIRALPLIGRSKRKRAWAIACIVLGVALVVTSSL